MAAGAASACLVLCFGAGVADASDLLRPVAPQPLVLGACGGVQPGTFLIPGSDTCLRLTGVVRSDLGLRNGAGDLRFANPASLATPSRPFPLSRGSGSAISTSAFIAADVRTQTELGPARLYVSIGRRGRLDRTGDVR